jgi:hypothetical protein
MCQRKRHRLAVSQVEMEHQAVLIMLVARTELDVDDIKGLIRLTGWHRDTLSKTPWQGDGALPYLRA